MRDSITLLLAAVLVTSTIGLIVTDNLLAAEPTTSITFNVSTPANGLYFAVGEQPVVTVVLPDSTAPANFARLNLYVYGPQETNETVTALTLLHASADRTTKPHHYIDLTTDPNVDVNGNVLTYHLQAVSDEKHGTYTASLWSVSQNDRLDQAMLLQDFQIGTSTVETQIVDKDKCAKCHLGAANGQFYFHHVDPSNKPDSVGNPSLESWPVRTCKSCHNTDGYASYRDPEDPNVRTPDPIVFRVHGIHMGASLENPRDTDPNTGIFRDYLQVEFPADVRNCTTCHADDRWKTKPSRLACGGCHDNIWFRDPAYMPVTAEPHPGGRQYDDSRCLTCHPPDGMWIEGVPPVPTAAVHKISTGTQFHVELSLTAPTNGTYYEEGETPQVTVVVKNAVTDEPVVPATMTEAEWSRLRLQVSGPRDHTKPVLTSAAADHTLSGSTSYIYNDLRVRTDPANEDPRVTRSATSITYQLRDVAGLVAGTYTVFVEARLEYRPSSVATIHFQVGTPIEEPKICTNCTDCHDDTRMHGSYPFDPDICKSCHDDENQLAGTTGWDDSNWGFGAAPLPRRIHGVHYGHYLDKPEEIHGASDAAHFASIIFPQDVRNCTKCHADNPMWKEEPSRLACLSCHDSDEAIFHGILMTYDPTWEDPYSGDEIETCEVCHGADSSFSPDKVHNIWDPYQPPYLRDPIKEADD